MVKKINEENIKIEWIKKVGYVTQKIYLLNDTIKQTYFMIQENLIIKNLI